MHQDKEFETVVPQNKIHALVLEVLSPIYEHYNNESEVEHIATDLSTECIDKFAEVCCRPFTEELGDESIELMRQVLGEL